MLGFPLGTPKTTGQKKKTKVPLPVVPVSLINNHLALTVKYHKPEDAFSAARGFRIVGFHVCLLPARNVL